MLVIDKFTGNCNAKFTGKLQCTIVMQNCNAKYDLVKNGDDGGGCNDDDNDAGGHGYHDNDDDDGGHEFEPTCQTVHWS